MKLSLTLFILVLFNINIFAQSPYSLNTQHEFAYYAGGITTAGLGLYLRLKTPDFTEAEIQQLRIADINKFDRSGTNFFSEKAHATSNYLWHGSHFMPFLFLAANDSRADIKKIAVMYGETVFITTGLTLLTKYSTRRARPFNYDPNTPLDRKQSSNAKGSFFSGHTSLTASNCFFTAKIFSDYFPDSEWKSAVWVAAAAIPAVTGYLRVRGGKHFPTDVIVGYIVGAGVGYFIPHFHRTNRKMKNLSISVGYKSAYMSLQF